MQIIHLITNHTIKCNANEKLNNWHVNGYIDFIKVFDFILIHNKTMCFHKMVATICKKSVIIINPSINTVLLVYHITIIILLQKMS